MSQSVLKTLTKFQQTLEKNKTNMGYLRLAPNVA